MIEIEKAKEIIQSQVFQLNSEILSIDEISGRVIAEDCFSDRNYPPFNRSAMDGFAVSSKHYSKGKKFKIVGTVQAGDLGDRVFSELGSVKIMTGARVPDNFDAVIKVEDSVVSKEEVYFQLDSISSFHNIARKGEDIKKDSPVLEKGHLLNPVSISLLASIGKTKVRVFQPPKVSILSTGNEIVPINANPLPEQIRDSNSYTLTEFLKKFHITPIQREILPDIPEEISKSIEKSLNSEIIFITGGVSMGEFDYVPKILAEKNVDCLFHKIEVKPGKPFWFGVGQNKQIVFALPGNPFAVQVAFKIFIEPFLYKLFQSSEYLPLKIPFLGERRKKHNLTEFFPVKLNSTGIKTGLSLVEFHGSGDIIAAAKSDGIACHPKEKFDLRDGELLYFYSWNTERV
ncbi:MAG: molybdopterin molybdotransferase MoeA [Leptospiraceae bacterium]|nr:molybdopterin molybdotransferase MoeA [Leptospiraceae bacterium]MCK6380039.1 molybdopterin molybdotransferase MoeA [Leptospiraceae bacterium]